jgi:glutaredoxin 3
MVRIYTTIYCGHCWRAKLLLQRRGIRYQEIDVTGDPAARAWLVQATGRRTVPQIFVDGRPIGGAAELARLDGEGELERLRAAGLL